MITGKSSIVESSNFALLGLELRDLPRTLETRIADGWWPIGAPQIIAGSNGPIAYVVMARQEWMRLRREHGPF